MNHANLDEIRITDLLARGRLGVPDDERVKPQDILINIILYADLSRCGKSDSIDDTVDYGKVANEVLALVERSERHTAEALAEDVAAFCLTFTGVEGARVRLEKPHRVRFVGAVGVEIERSR